MMTKSQTQQRTTPKGLTVRHCNFFSCSNSLRLPVHYDTSSKNTVAHSPFEHLDHHDISKIVILPHKSHVSHKYKCMNDGFFINQRADQKKFVRAEHHSMYKVTSSKTHVSPQRNNNFLTFAISYSKNLR